ncbi:hypothetical protein [Burkholderia gladioli]|uniref:hypothetical protein n=1 Tax=Burkholderia gladioli TaxID=28095 RepID=UPI0016413441|nr:hypothetical protein [Burkholderia gladioli]
MSSTDAEQKAFINAYRNVIRTGGFVYRDYVVGYKVEGNEFWVNPAADEFHAKFLEPFLQLAPQFDPYAIQDEAFASEVRDHVTYLRLLSAFAAAAKHRFESGDRSKGWTFLCRANYFLGQANVRAWVPVHVKHRLAERGRLAHEATLEKWAPVIEEMRRRASKLKQAGVVTLNGVATQLAPEMYDFARSIDVHAQSVTQMKENIRKYCADIIPPRPMKPRRDKST